ncbi:LEA domain protein [Aspergillus luchuensis]|uniref:LEA domain protein n=1 Tax=Aspergillus kawachii TaxID=1069201 RepID=A0A146F0E7_ASPKA|nr:LEA domain protein [Aspergillus luchuensis]
MASPAPPSTPKAASAPAATPDGSQTPGKWRHPHLNEVVRRQNAVLRVIFALNILVALYPLFRPKDNFSDIPLTPTQRSLLGLDPSATQSFTPGTTYVTPPRYRLSASRNASPASRSGSPLSASAGASGHRLSSGPSFSPSPSPLLHKVVTNGSKESGRRPSFGSSSPLGRSSSFSPFKESSFKESTFKDSTSTFRESTMSTFSGMSSIAPATPSPVGGKRVSLGLSNKWLYERSRRLSASNGSL